jgi:hypothetical protein
MRVAGSYKGLYGKRENINQVIKDCFITKKYGVRAMPQNQPTTISQLDMQPVKRRGPSELSKHNRDQMFTSSLGYYANAASSSKKPRRLKSKVVESQIVTTDYNSGQMRGQKHPYAEMLAAQYST